MTTARRRRRQPDDGQLSIAFVPGGLRPYRLHKFDHVIDEYVYNLTLAGCSKEAGDASAGGHYCAVDLGPDVLPHIQWEAADAGDQLTTEEENLVLDSVSAIVRTGESGSVSVSYYDNKREFDRAWQRIEENCAEDEEDEED